MSIDFTIVEKRVFNNKIEDFQAALDFDLNKLAEKSSVIENFKEVKENVYAIKTEEENVVGKKLFLKTTLTYKVNKKKGLLNIYSINEEDDNLSLDLKIRAIPENSDKTILAVKLEASVDFGFSKIINKTIKVFVDKKIKKFLDVTLDTLELNDIKEWKMKKSLLVLGLITIFSANVFADNKTDKDIALEKLNNITNYYIEEIANTEKDEARLNKIIADLERDLGDLKATSEQIEIRKNLIKELYVDLKDTKTLYLLEFDKNGDIKKEIREAALAIKMSLNDDSKIVKVKLKNGKFLPLIKYKVKKNDTLKKILMNTYPKNYKPTWSEISARIKTLVKINKNVIKMNYIYPGQTIYIPLYKDNPDEAKVKENIIEQKKKKVNW